MRRNRGPASTGTGGRHAPESANTYKVRAEAALNHNARNAEYAFSDTEDEPLYHFLAHLEIGATCTYPQERAGNAYDLTIYGEDHPDSDVFWKLKDVQVIGEHHARQYREYRGKRVPVYDPPKGMGILDKERGQSNWRGAIWAQRVSSVTPRLFSVSAGRCSWKSWNERSSGTDGSRASRSNRPIQQRNNAAASPTPWQS